MNKQAIPRLVPQSNEVDLGSEVRSPIDILRAQTSYWKDLTNGDVLGEVESTFTIPTRVAYWFGFVVPALNGYRYQLFMIEHALEFYPAWLSLERGDPNPIQVLNEEELYTALRTQFRSERTLNIVRKLRALVAEAQTEKAQEKD